MANHKYGLFKDLCRKNLQKTQLDVLLELVVFNFRLSGWILNWVLIINKLNKLTKNKQHDTKKLPQNCRSNEFC